MTELKNCAPLTITELGVKIDNEFLSLRKLHEQDEDRIRKISSMENQHALDILIGFPTIGVFLIISTPSLLFMMYFLYKKVNFHHQQQREYNAQFKHELQTFRGWFTIAKQNKKRNSTKVKVRF